MYKQVTKGRFIIYLLIVLCTVSLGIIKRPITQLLFNIFPNINEINPAIIHYIMMFFIGICYYIIGKIYNSILSSRKIERITFVDGKYKLIILCVVLFIEDIL